MLRSPKAVILRGTTKLHGDKSVTIDSSPYTLVKTPPKKRKVEESSESSPAVLPSKRTSIAASKASSTSVPSISLAPRSTRSAANRRSSSNLIKLSGGSKAIPTSSEASPPSSIQKKSSKAKKTVDQALSPSPQSESFQESLESLEGDISVTRRASAGATALQTPAASHMDSDWEDDAASAESSNFQADDDDDNSDISLDDEVADYDDQNEFDLQDGGLKPKRPVYEVEYKVYDPSELQVQQKEQVDEVSMITDLPPEASAILLRHSKWNKEKLMEQYMEKPESILKAAGISKVPSTKPQIRVMKTFECGICCDDDSNVETFALECGDRFCIDCFRQYLVHKITEEGEAARIRCPGDKCSQVVDAKALSLVVPEDTKVRYLELLTRAYVDEKDQLKYCPAPNCQYVVECAVKPRDLTRKVPTVKCNCGHPFCFGCSKEDHQPAPCGLVKRWIKKCEDDSETANWISANTKECPKCQSTIEKNGGCNHMTCRKCKHEFCWMCMGVWSEHGTSWYNCNRYEEKSGAEARDAQTKSRLALDRYLFYYNRFANHQQSAKLDKDIALKAEKKMTQLQTQSDLSWIEVQFINNASECLQQCRQTLKWTYAFAYYLAKNNETEIFEDIQKDLEMAVENLSEMFEKPTDQLSGLKVEMMDKISYCNKRRIIVLTTTAEGLLAGHWLFNTEFAT